VINSNLKLWFEIFIASLMKFLEGEVVLIVIYDGGSEVCCLHLLCNPKKVHFY
jgi:uncharacterized membrane protein YdcZ (DUF606 family)